MYIDTFAYLYFVNVDYIDQTINNIYEERLHFFLDFIVYFSLIFVQIK